MGSQRVGHDTTFCLSAEGRQWADTPLFVSLGIHWPGAFSVLPTATISLLADPFPSRAAVGMTFESGKA